MNDPNRRWFLLSSLGVGYGLLSPPAAAAIEPITRNGKPRMRLSLAGYAFRDYFQGKRKPKMNLIEFADFAAQAGFDAIEPTAYYFTDTTDTFLARLKGQCTRLGLDISSGAVGNNFCTPEPADLRREIEQVKAWTERYSVLGAKTIRIFAGQLQRGDDISLARVRCIDAIEEVCAHAGKFGIYLALENHGGITKTVDDLLALVKAVKSRWFGVNLDTGHFRSSTPYADLARVAPYAISVQLKTEIHPNNGTEEADLPRLIEILKNVNYRGYVILEYEAKDDPMIATPRVRAVLEKLIV